MSTMDAFLKMYLVRCLVLWDKSSYCCKRNSMKDCCYLSSQVGTRLLFPACGISSRKNVYCIKGALLSD